MIPPLSARHGDPLLLAHVFIRRFAKEQHRTALTFSEDALRAIESHPWPGNVRELLSAVKRAAIMAEGQRVTAEDLGLHSADDYTNDTVGSSLDLRSARENAERTAVVAALARTDGNIAKAAELLGVSRPTLYDLMHRLVIK
jgi:two-component system NtrC family response regulator